MTVLRAEAPAKLNLCLHLTGRRHDGYHLLESLVTFTAVADILEVEAAEQVSLQVTGPFAQDAGSGEGNLVLKAARLLQTVGGVQRGARLRLSKNIPVGGGLGGGSADAAAALQLLNQLWALGLSREALLQLSPQLGADVAMCVAGQSAMARGIGEVLEPLALPSVPVVLAHPRVPLLTKDVYTAFAQAGAPFQPSGLHYAGGDLLAFLRATHNDLQAPAIACQPIVAQVLAALEASGATFSRMTGSGACCFALYAEEAAAQNAARVIAAAHPAWWVEASVISPR